MNNEKSVLFMTVEIFRNSVTFQAKIGAIASEKSKKVAIGI